MSPARGDRADWELADGPVVGEDVPLTSAPREEHGGEPVEPESQPPAAEAEAEPELEEREVVSADPELSPETNERLTAELREVVGRDRVRVPADRPRVSAGEPGPQSGPLSFISIHRLNLIRTGAIALTVGAIIALASGQWWVLPLAAGLHAVGTMAVMLTSLRLASVTEHPAPEVAAAMSEDGISGPDERFSAMVGEFSEPQPGGAGEVISPGHNERTVHAGDEPAAAAAEQSSAMTPTSHPSRAAGEGSAPTAWSWSIGLVLLVASIAIPAASGGGWLWLLTAVMVPLLGGWAGFERLVARAPQRTQATSSRAQTAIVSGTIAGVVIFCALVALAFQH
jgi:hypothetical protein